MAKVRKAPTLLFLKNQIRYELAYSSYHQTVLYPHILLSIILENKMVIFPLRV